MSNLAQRLLSAGVLAPLLIAAIFAEDPRMFVGVAVAASCIASLELGRMVGFGSRAIALTLATLSGLVTLAVASLHDASPLLGVIGSAMMLGLTANLLMPTGPYPSTIAMPWSLAGWVYIALPLGLLARLRQLPDGSEWILFTMLVTWLGDTGAYFVGRLVGKRPLFSSVSPNKTWEGALGGLLGSLSAVGVAQLVFFASLPLMQAIGLALVAGTMSQLGDLSESLLKRSVGAKDSGTLLPGHGGMLDRIDGLLFSAPTVWAHLTFLAPLLEA